MHDDHSFLKRFTASGDETAFAAIVSNHLPMVFGVCLRRTGNRELAEEITQNVFASLARKAAAIGTDVNLSGWLHRAASFECSHALRTESNRNRNMKRFAELQPEPEPAEADLHADEVSRQLDEAIHQLPKKEQDMVLMRFSEELTLREIGGRMGKSESATQRHLSNVLEKLAFILRRRGVTTSALALAAVLSADLSKAAPVGFTAASVSKAALAAASTSTPTILTTIAIAMTKKTATIAAGIILITVAGGIAMRNKVEKTPVTPPDFTVTPSQRAQAEVTSRVPETAQTDPGNSRNDRTTDADARLVARYGESRVKLSRHIANRMIHLHDLFDGMASGAAAINGEGTNSNVRVLTLGEGDLDGINLKDLSDPEKIRELNAKKTEPSEEQIEMRKKAEEQMQAMRDSRESLKQDSTPLQEMLLAADAVTRGEMTQGEYDTMLKESPLQAPHVSIGGLGAKQTADASKPKSLEDSEKEVEKQVKAMEAINSLIDTTK